MFPLKSHTKLVIVYSGYVFLCVRLRTCVFTTVGGEDSLSQWAPVAPVT